MTKAEQFARKVVEEHLKDLLIAHMAGRISTSKTVDKIFKSIDYILEIHGGKKAKANKGNTRVDESRPV